MLQVLQFEFGRTSEKGHSVIDFESIGIQIPVLDIEAREEVSWGGWDGHHHLLGHPPLLQVPHKHPGGGADLYGPHNNDRDGDVVLNI